MTPEQLHDMLKKIQEPKGYFFNPDSEMTMQLLEGLLTKKEQQGYMTCPCRLNTGEMAKDKDIMCPCEYREPDVAEYNICFCGLYVSKDVSEGKATPAEVVPERRPPEKIPSL